MITIKKTSQGFTLFEIMIAIAILGGLMALFYPIIRNYQKRAAVQTADMTLTQLKTAINLYKTDTGQYPNSLQDLVRKPSAPKAAAKWVSEYATEELVEKPELEYRRTPQGKHPYELDYIIEGQEEPRSAWK